MYNCKYVLGGGGRLGLGRPAGSWAAGRLDLGAAAGGILGGGGKGESQRAFWPGCSGGWRKLMGLGFHGALGKHIRKKLTGGKKKLKSFDSKGWTSRD